MTRPTWKGDAWRIPPQALISAVMVNDVDEPGTLTVILVACGQVGWLLDGVGTQ